MNRSPAKPSTCASPAIRTQQDMIQHPPVRSSNPSKILTKGNGSRDFDLLDGNDWYGITLDGMADHETYADRMFGLIDAYFAGIKTWISFEPVTNCAAFFSELNSFQRFVYKVKIGKLNYHPSDIDWKEFGHAVEAQCKRLGIDYYIKDSLRAEMTEVRHEP